MTVPTRITQETFDKLVNSSKYAVVEVRNTDDDAMIRAVAPVVDAHVSGRCAFGALTVDWFLTDPQWWATRFGKAHIGFAPPFGFHLFIDGRHRLWRSAELQPNSGTMGFDLVLGAIGLLAGSPALTNAALDSIRVEQANLIARAFKLHINLAILESWGRPTTPANPLDDPFAVLGVSAACSFEEIKKAHWKIVRENHPDKVTGAGGDEAARAAAHERTARANVAFAEIKRRRNL
ncbi:J domain-containing protein [Polyangium fumosum]|uniref:J domain-containing protein n=1 Tax=Polyangium fumosum TaxID=889272 RepID=A0A4U1IV33_9BACT|nr:J domain-containing protein [Polyangium fumosum]TKC98286.1 hypothetical protein E8A74_41680 [Polyangium fumosum]